MTLVVFGAVQRLMNVVVCGLMLVAVDTTTPSTEQTRVQVNHHLDISCYHKFIFNTLFYGQIMLNIRGSNVIIPTTMLIRPWISSIDHNNVHFRTKLKSCITFKFFVCFSKLFILSYRKSKTKWCWSHKLSYLLIIRPHKCFIKTKIQASQLCY